MNTPAPCVLTLNAGSSSLRFALVAAGNPLHVLVRGKIERIGLAGTTWSIRESHAAAGDQRALAAVDHDAAADHLFAWLAAWPGLSRVCAVAHRVVHGMTHTAPEQVTDGLLTHLRQMVEIDPEHLPFEIALIEASVQRYPALLQVACFDTAFHRSMPQVARLLPIPRHFQSMGIERYGFHGLSYEYLLDALSQAGDPAATQGRVILAHLGNGASMAAVRDGRSIDTSMGFTPVAGLMMGTRSGDLDPGISPYLARTLHQTAAQFQHMVSQASGLLGVSGISPDIRDLLAQEATDPRAAEAIAMFCYSARKWIGAFAASLGGLDTLVFSGGIGENAPMVRARICNELGFLGIRLDDTANAQSAALISRLDCSVRVRVIRTDEEVVLARHALAVGDTLGLQSPERHSHAARL